MLGCNIFRGFIRFFCRCAVSIRNLYGLETFNTAIRSSRSRNNTIQNIEKKFSMRINDKIERNMKLSYYNGNSEKIFIHIQVETDVATETFIASRG